MEKYHIYEIKTPEDIDKLKLHYDDSLRFVCKKCGKQTFLKHIDLRRLDSYKTMLCWSCKHKEYRKNLSKEKIQEMINKSKQTRLEKYGDQNYNNRDKFKKTCLDTYGDEYYNNRNKAKQTTLKTYGVENIMFLSEYAKKATYNFKANHNGLTLMEYNKTKECKDKIKDTCRKKYNSDYFVTSETFKNNKEKDVKAEKTWLEKHGVKNLQEYVHTQEYLDNVKRTYNEKYNNDYYFGSEKYKKDMFEKYKSIAPINSPVLKEKYNKTWNEKYNVNSLQEYSKTKECKDKVKNTCIERYNNATYLQSDDWKNKSKNTYNEHFNNDYTVCKDSKGISLFDIK